VQKGETGVRAFAGIIVGLVAGFLAVVLIGIVGIGATFSPPPGFDTNDPRQVLEAFGGMPLGPKLILMGAWFGGGLVGGLAAKAIARSGWAVWTVTGLIAVYVLLNMLVLPLPGWMQALSIAAPLIGGFIANHLVKAAVPAPMAASDGETI
jgi:hypothetical protein